MVQQELIKGTIFDIQGFSVHDGPGCRTLIFFKGCSLECEWCSNPEGISHFPEPLYRDTKCISDGLCIAACPHAAITISEENAGNRLIFNRRMCAKCHTHACVKACCSGALNIGGYEISTEDLYVRISRDRSYWGPHGGITLTGGEPFVQPAFALEFLKRCYDGYIHTAVETCGNVPWKNYEEALPYIDWVFFDLKTLNESAIDHVTSSPASQIPNFQTSKLPNSPASQPVKINSSRSGVSPVPRILENASHLSSAFNGRLIFRLPLIPGFNDDPENICETARFILSTGRKEINILPLHHMGREKYNLVGKNYYTSDFQIPGKDELQKIASCFTSQGITCYIGSETPF